LVDTSVLIDAFKGVENEKTRLFKRVLEQSIPYGISSYTYQEVLQGAGNEREYATLKESLNTQRIYFLAEEISTYEKAARMYYDLRRGGMTIRSAIDVLIALTAIEYGLLLLHNDRDFDLMRSQLKDLKMFEM